jgi:hexosaminidase
MAGDGMSPTYPTFMLREQVLEHGDMPGLSKETVVDVWLNSNDAIRVLEKGYKIIHAAVEYFYLVSLPHFFGHRQDGAHLQDCGHGNWIGADGGGPSWCDPFKSWQRIYS